MSDPGHMKQSKMGVLPSRSLQFSRKKNTKLIKTSTANYNRSKKKKRHLNSMLKKQKGRGKQVIITLPNYEKKFITFKCFYILQIILFKYVVIHM